MIFTNEAAWDRTLRILVGIALLYAASQVWSGIPGMVLLLAGTVALVTGLVGWCPAYSVLHRSTKRSRI